MSSETNVPQNQPETASSEAFPYRVKTMYPAELHVVDFVTKEGNLQGPRKLILVLPTGERLVMSPDVSGLPPLTQEELQSMDTWQEELRKKAQLLGGNIVINPVTGDVSAAPQRQSPLLMPGG